MKGYFCGNAVYVKAATHNQILKYLKILNILDRFLSLNHFCFLQRFFITCNERLSHAGNDLCLGFYLVNSKSGLFIEFEGSRVVKAAGVKP